MKKRGSHGGHRGHKGGITESTWWRRLPCRRVFWERQLLCWQVIKNRGHTETTEGTEDTKERDFYESQHLVIVFSVYSVFSVRNFFCFSKKRVELKFGVPRGFPGQFSVFSLCETSFGFGKTCRTKLQRSQVIARCFLCETSFGVPERFLRTLRVDGASAPKEVFFQRPAHRNERDVHGEKEGERKK